MTIHSPFTKHVALFLLGSSWKPPREACISWPYLWRSAEPSPSPETAPDPFSFSPSTSPLAQALSASWWACSAEAAKLRAGVSIPRIRCHCPMGWGWFRLSSPTHGPAPCLSPLLSTSYMPYMSLPLGRDRYSIWENGSKHRSNLLE